jgi:hypothetical protein
MQPSDLKQTAATMIKNCYHTLQVDPYSEPAVIQAAYNRLTQPAQPADELPAARLKEIEAAYAILSDPQKRDEYDLKNGWKVSPNAAQAAAATLARPCPQASAPRFGALGGVSGLSHCECCGLPAETKYVRFGQNIGVFFRRYYQEVDGNLCRDCIEHYFWMMTGKTFLMGWWGMISFILTPPILIGNVVSYLGALRVKRSPFAEKPPINHWKMTLILTLAAVVLLSATAISRM